ncbi:MAG TPA: hypothetical protein ENH82_09060 [bacterium]|nr:hypothetical protein [bacterium]
MAEKVKDMLRSNVGLCVLVLIAIGVTSIVFAADVKVKAGKVKAPKFELPNDTYLTADNAAGTGTVDLIKANTSDVAVIPDGSELATSAAPTADADIANKKYVDDYHVFALMYNSIDQNIPSATWTKREFDTSEIDSTGSIVDLANERFTPGVAGYYLVAIGGQITDVDEGYYTVMQIRKNGDTTIAGIAEYPGDTSGVADPGMSVSTIVYLDADDYVEAWFFHNRGSERKANDGRAHNFYICRIG